jgi:hypothetical protein
MFSITIFGIKRILYKNISQKHFFLLSLLYLYMSHTNSPHPPHHHPENRDPIMEDNHFSLRYDNPIQVIHNAPKHEVDEFAPSKHYMPPSLLNAIEQEEGRPVLKKKSSSVIRDTSCNEYFHNKNGTVGEIDHTQDE